MTAASQNIAFYFWLGTNQQLTGNTVNFQADGTRTEGTGARSFGFQNSTTGGTGYDGLRHRQQHLPGPGLVHGIEKSYGIWENGHNDDNAPTSRSPTTSSSAAPATCSTVAWCCPRRRRSW